jgi:hypothetical protein
MSQLLSVSLACSLVLLLLENECTAGCRGRVNGNRALTRVAIHSALPRPDRACAKGAGKAPEAFTRSMPR